MSLMREAVTLSSNASLIRVPNLVVMFYAMIRLIKGSEFQSIIIIRSLNLRCLRFLRELRWRFFLAKEVSVSSASRISIRADTGFTERVRSIGTELFHLE